MPDTTEKKSQWGLLALLGVGAFLFFEGKKLANSVIIKFKSIGISDGSILAPEINVTFTVVNPAMIPAKFYSMTGHISAYGELFADAYSNNPVLITAGGSADITITITSFITNYINLVQKIIANNGNMQFGFEGSFNVDGIDIPYTTSETINLPVIHV